MNPSTKKRNTIHRCLLTTKYLVFRVVDGVVSSDIEIAFRLVYFFTCSAVGRVTLP